MEMAYRMQTEAPDVFDIRKESKATLELYGPGSTARGCLMAVRLVERGVRMVQVYYAKGDPWDAHSDIQQHRKNAKDSDQPFAAVIKDLKSRGLFDDTLVVCGSEFGRTPVVEVGGMATAQSGRDHNPFGFSVWLAGGGVKGGITYGATDDFGFKAIDKPVHVHDLHATILHLMGIDHTKLTYSYSGRDFRLTDVVGHRPARHSQVVRSQSAAVRPSGSRARAIAGGVGRAHAIGRAAGMSAGQSARHRYSPYHRIGSRARPGRQRPLHNDLLPLERQARALAIVHARADDPRPAASARRDHRHRRRRRVGRQAAAAVTRVR